MRSSAHIVLEIRDDGEVHAIGLRGTPGEAWNHFVEVGDEITLQNHSSRSLFVDVTFRGPWPDGQIHKALDRLGSVFADVLPAGTGSFTWALGREEDRLTVRAYADGPHEGEVPLGIVSEPDQSRYGWTVLDVR